MSDADKHIGPVVIIDIWDFYDGPESGTCRYNEEVYSFYLRDWSNDGLYPIDDDGKDLSRIYDLYQGRIDLDSGPGDSVVVGWCSEEDFMAEEKEYMKLLGEDK